MHQLLDCEMGLRSELILSEYSNSFNSILKCQYLRSELLKPNSPRLETGTGIGTAGLHRYYSVNKVPPRRDDCNTEYYAMHTT